MNKTTKTPKLRFPQFTDAWEQRQAKSIFYSVSEKGYPNMPVLSATQDKGMIKRDETGIDIKYEQDSLANYKLVKKGQFVIHLRSFQGGFAYSEIEGITSPAYTILDFQEKNHSPEFWRIVFTSSNFIKRLGTVIYGIRDGRSINYKDFSELNLSFPSHEEQTAIGNFFRQVDGLITLRQRELDHTKTLKKGLLQKMFPKQGQTVPELRFPQFTDAWERCKLGEIVERVRGNDGRMDLPTLTMSASVGWLNQVDRFSSNIAGNEQKNYTLLKKGQLSYNHGNSKLAKYGVVFELNSYEEALVPKVYHSFKTNQHSVASFLEYMFATKLPDRELGKLVSSGTRMDGLLNISYDDFMGIQINIPKPNEQTTIGNFFRQIDGLITLRQRQLEHLKLLKKALLQQMFV